MVTGSGTIYAESSTADITNQAGATFDFQAPAELDNQTFSLTFTNAGTLEQSTGTGTVTVDYAVSDSGTIESDSGTLVLDGGGAGSNAVINAGASGVVILSGSFSGSFSGSGAGAVELANFTGSGTSGATLDFSGSTLQWTDILGGIITNAGTMTVVGTGQKLLYGPLTNSGTIAVTGSGTIYGESSTANITNQAGATFDFQAPAELDNNTLSLTFTNAGTLERSAGTGTATVDYAVSDSGTIESDSGTLELDGGGSGTNGVINAGANGVVTLYGSFAGSFSGSGAGAVELASFTGSGTTGATLDFSGSTLQWAGTLGGIITNTGTMTVEGAGQKLLYGPLTNTGTIAVTYSGIIYAESSTADITNQAGATFDFQAPAELDNQTFSLTFTNAGTLESSSTTGAAKIDYAREQYWDRRGRLRYPLSKRWPQQFIGNNAHRRDLRRLGNRPARASRSQHRHERRLDRSRRPGRRDHQPLKCQRPGRVRDQRSWGPVHNPGRREPHDGRCAE